MHGDEMILEMARLEREAWAKIAAKHAASQLGEAWIGLDTRRVASSVARGPDRRHDMALAA
jgi:hypothetical protein